MDIIALESSSEGKLIHIMKQKSGFIAPTRGGIIKFNKLGEIVELGLDHNTTLKLKEPIAFTFVSSDSIAVKNVIRKRAKLLQNTISMTYKIFTNKGIIISKVRLDTNDDSEVVVTASLYPKKDKKVIGNMAMQFNIMDDYMEILNSSDLKLAVLNNEKDDLFVINSIDAVKTIEIKSYLDGDIERNTCIVTSQEIIDKTYYVPMIYKLGIKRTTGQAKRF